MSRFDFTLKYLLEMKIKKINRLSRRLDIRINEDRLGFLFLFYFLLTFYFFLLLLG